MKILPASIRRKLKDTEIDLGSPWGRLRAWNGLYLADHGFLRVFWTNDRPVSPDMRRRNQPSPGQIARHAREGVKTILNLRGASNTGYYVLEREACARHGLALIDFRAFSREAPSKEMLFAARDLFKSIEYPAVMHCKSGADRAGLMSALYLVVHEGAGVDDALGHLSLRYGHIKSGKTGILDAFFERYRTDAAQTQIAFFDWVENVYDPELLKQNFKPTALGDFLVDAVLRRE